MILGVIPARGGSKGIPYKNLMNIAGKPLIYWSIKAAQESNLLDKFVVSTEDDKIAKMAKSFDATVLDRPVELADDNATTIAVLQHALRKFPEADAVLLMQPTSPIRINNLIDKVITEYNNDKNIDSLATGYLCRYWKWGSRKKNLPRQVDPGYFYDDGNLYILNRKDIENGDWCGNNLKPFETETYYHYEIDDIYEAIATEAVMAYLLKNKNINGKKSKDFFQKVKLIVFDFDGVFTNNKVIVNENGIEAVICDRSDSYGLSLIKDKLKENDIKVLVLSTEKNDVVKKRAEKLNLNVLHGTSDKLNSLMNYCRERDISMQNTVFIGNDLNDFEVMCNCGFSVATGDADERIKKIADYIIPRNGGDGAVRYFSEYLLKLLKN
jgi:YrbI family 3-deoxy-D-manno-octulosonate 8-phosphate phosphatase